MKKNLLYIGCILAFSNLLANEQPNSTKSKNEADEFTKWQQAQSAEGNAIQDEYLQFRQVHLNEFSRYVVETYKEYDSFRNKLIQEWGDAKVSSQSEYVSYSSELDARLEMNFENDAITLSIKHASDGLPDERQIENLFQQFKKDNAELFENFAQSALKDLHVDDFELVKQTKVDNAQRVNALLDAREKIREQIQAQQALVDKKISNEAAISDSVSQDSINNAIKIKSELADIEQQRLIDLVEAAKSLPDNPKVPIVSKYQIKFPQSGLAEKRAKGYKAEISHHSKRFEIEPSLVLAVMHTESHFNPKARSYIPAFGLMQVVPTSAGVDVNRFLYKRDEPMTESYLYVSNNNIEAGTAYLHILNNRYLKDINDPVSRKYCMIAAYNTGAGNVARVFNSDNSRSIKKAAKVINTMSPDRVLAILQSSLPYQETRHYIQKVLKHEKLYI